MSHGAGDHDDHGDHGEVGHVAPLRGAIGTGVALLVLTWITVAVAGFDLGEVNIYVAMGIAVLKATLVCLFFMHLRWDRPFNAIVFVGSVGFLALFLGLTMTDSAEYKPDRIGGDAKDVIATIQAEEVQE